MELQCELIEFLKWISMPHTVERHCVGMQSVFGIVKMAVGQAKRSDCASHACSSAATSVCVEVLEEFIEPGVQSENTKHWLWTVTTYTHSTLFGDPPTPEW